MAPKRPVRLVQSEVWLGRTEFEDLIRPRDPEAAEAPRYLATATKAIEVRPLTGRPSRVSSVAPLFSPVPALIEDDGLIRLDGLEPAHVEAANRPAPPRSRRFPRWAAGGVLGLALAGSAASVLLLTSHGGAAEVTARNAVSSRSVPVILSPNAGGDHSSEPIDAGQMAVAAPKPPEDMTVRSAQASVPASHTGRSDNRTTAPPKHAAPVTPPPLAGQAALDQAYNWWAQAAAYGAKNPRWTHLDPEPPHWR